MSRYRNYFDLQLEYEKFYKKKVVILKEVGVFYECYEYKPKYDYTYISYKDYDQTVGYATELSDKLQFVCNFMNPTRPHSIDNPIEMGFPKILSDKYIKHILNYGYIVIKLECSKADPALTHCVTEIIHPS